MRKISILKLAIWLFMPALILLVRGSVLAAIEARPQEQLFYQGNLAYKESKYDLAIEDYEKLIRSGWENGNLYYNLGNSYFKKGELGKAVLNYGRAKQFIPDDSDLKSNYAYCLSLLNLDTQQKFGNKFSQIAERIFLTVTINQLTLLLSALYFLLLLGLTVMIWLPGSGRFTKPVILLLLAALICGAQALYGKITYSLKGGVVIVKEAQVKFEPLASATTYFNISEGSRVEVMEQNENWYKVKRFDGKFGWLNKESLELINQARDGSQHKAKLSPL